MSQTKIFSYCWVTCILVLILAFTAHAQQKDTIPQTDAVELLFKKHVAKQLAKKKNKKVYISVLPAFGTTPATGFAGVVATNFAFHLGKGKTDLSSISANMAYTIKRQFTMPIRSIIWSKDNKWNFLGDWRFIKYPQNTYGIGARSSIEQEVEVDYLYLRFYQHVLHSVVSHFYVGGGVFCDQYWDIKQLDWDKPFQSNFEKYGYGTASRVYTSGLGINLLWDDRKNVITPKQGSYANFVYRFNPSYFGNEETWESAYLDLRKYLYLPSKSKKNILAFWLLYWGITRGQAPYFLLPSNSWDTYTSSVRGYVQGRFRSKHMVAFETEYRYGITRNGLLGGVVFANVSSYAEPNGGKMKYVNPAVGAGLRIKLNKTSNTNLMIDFAFGLPTYHGLYVDVGEIF